MFITKKKECRYDKDLKRTVRCKTDLKTGQTSYAPKKSYELTNNIKKRLLVVFLAFTVFFLPFAINQIATLLNLETNPSEVNLFQQNNVVSYRYENGTLGHSSVLRLDIDLDGKNDVTSVRYVVDSRRGNFYCDYDTGRFIENNSVSEKYPIFWVFTPNILLNFLETIERKQFSVVDPVGILGPINESYAMIALSKTIYWNVEPALKGAQMSIEFSIYDSSNNRVASGLVDTTSGILETMYFSGKRLTLVNPGIFPMSRHRELALPWAIGFAIAIPLIVYFYLRRKSDKKQAEEISLVLAIGTSAVVIDLFLDIWFYALVGLNALLLIHLVATAVYALIFLRLEIGLKWCIPSVIELAFITSLTLVTGVSFIPYMTAITGLLVTFFVGVS